MCGVWFAMVQKLLPPIIVGSIDLFLSFAADRAVVF